MFNKTLVSNWLTNFSLVLVEVPKKIKETPEATE